MHPYEMYQTLIERREDRLMKIRPGTLYHAVNRLLGQHLISEEGTEGAGNRPERTNYSIEPGGYQALREHLSELLREVVNEYPGFRRGVAEAHHLTKEEVTALLTERADALAEEIADLEANSSALVSRGLPRALWLDIGYDLEILAAQLKWVRRTIRELQSDELPWADYSGLIANHPY